MKQVEDQCVLVKCACVCVPNWMDLTSRHCFHVCRTNKKNILFLLPHLLVCEGADSRVCVCLSVSI